MTRPAADPASALPRAGLLALWSATATATVLLWFPAALLPIVDGLLFTTAWPLLLRDFALLAWLGALASLLWSACAWLVAAALRRAPRTRGQADLVAWCIALLPLAWAVGWHAARVALQWLRSVAQLELPVSQGGRLAAVALLAALLLALLWRLGARRLLARAAGALLAARGPALALLLAGAVLLLWRPPALYLGGGKPAATPPPGPDIVLISLDTVAAADAAACAVDSAFMPRLAAFAAGATCFERFYASANFTTPTVSTMESGLLPWTHFAAQPDTPMAPPTRGHTLAAALRQAGWHTATVTDNFLASPRHRGTQDAYHAAALAATALPGDAVRAALSLFVDSSVPRLAVTAVSFIGAFDKLRLAGENPYRAERVYAQAATLWAQRPAGTRTLLWAHTLPPHSPFLPPLSHKYKLLPPGQLDTWSQMLPDNIAYAPPLQPLVDQHRLRYRELMMAADQALGEFLERLQREGVLDRAIVVITSDHGESFEQGWYGHAGAPTHDPLTRIPLVIRLPGQREGRVVPQAVSQADLAPTLLDLAGAPALPQAEGRSLRPLLEGGSLPEAPVFTMSMERQSRLRPIQQGRYSVIAGPHKATLVLDPDGRGGMQETLLLHDVLADPGEQRDLAAGMPQRAAELGALLRSRIADAERRRAAAQQAGAAR